MTTRRRISLERLVFDPAHWPRVTRDDARVAHLADLLRAGQALPPIKIQKGTAIVLGGWHTAAACRVVGTAEYDVEVVDIPDGERLLFAYHEDRAAALPYSDADTRSVARRLYAQRCTNGNAPNVVELARDLGRSRQAVDRYVADLVEKQEKAAALKRAAREVAVQAYRAASVSTRDVARFVGVTQMQVRRDAHVGITSHLADGAIVAEAQSLISLALGLGATPAQMAAARDWLIGQTQPEYLAQRERRRAWLAIASEVREWGEHAGALTIPDTGDWAAYESARTDLRRALEQLAPFLAELKGRLDV